MNNSENEKKSMNNAYRIAQELLKDRLKEVNPEAFKEMLDVEDADVIVIGGTYDHIEMVLKIAGTPFTLIRPADVEQAAFRPDQVVFVNCPGNIGPLGLRKLNTFVLEGGFLFTTDWALKHVLEEAFPGYIKYNQHATADEVVRVEILDTKDPFLKSLLGPKDDPQWWLEGSSYPIQIINKKSVHILVSSKEIKEKYGESPVFVTFDYGEGKIYHMISHFYLQRSETRTKRHKYSAVEYLNEKKISVDMKAKYSEMYIENMQLGDVESAYTSAAMMNKIMYDKKKQMKGKKNGKQKEQTGPETSKKS
ncbi:hypothetical protein ACFLRX_03150 [Acidobacteriota bacterium]